MARIGDGPLAPRFRVSGAVGRTGEGVLSEDAEPEEPGAEEQANAGSYVEANPRPPRIVTRPPDAER